MKYRVAKKVLRCVPMRGGGVRLSRYPRRTIEAAKVIAGKHIVRRRRALLAEVDRAIAAWDAGVITRAG